MLTGAIGGLQGVAGQNNVTTATGATLPPQVAVSSAAPEAVGVDSSVFTQTKTLAVPYAFIKNPASAAVAGITNLTQRQAYYLDGAAGTLPVSFFGGSGTNLIDWWARNTASAVRTEIDANIYYSGTLATYTTNSSGQPIPDASANPGQSSGGAIRSLLGVITNAIGTVAAQDIKTFTPLAYGRGALLGGQRRERQLSAVGLRAVALPERRGQQGAPSANQLTVINALLCRRDQRDLPDYQPGFCGELCPTHRDASLAFERLPTVDQSVRCSELASTVTHHPRMKEITQMISAFWRSCRPLARGLDLPGWRRIPHLSRSGIQRCRVRPRQHKSICECAGRFQRGGYQLGMFRSPPTLLAAT